VGILARLAQPAKTIAHRLSTPPAARPSLVGMPAPPLRGVDPAGTEREITLGRGGRHLVAFLTSSCAPCQALWAGLAAGSQTPAGTHLAIVTPDPATESRRAIVALAPAGADVVMSSRAWFDYGVAGAPWFALVVDGVIEAERHARAWSDVDRLMP